MRRDGIIEANNKNERTMNTTIYFILKSMKMDCSSDVVRHNDIPKCNKTRTTCQMTRKNNNNNYNGKKRTD